MADLTTAAFLALAASCAPQVAPQTLLAIATVESDLSPWVVHDNTAKHQYSPVSAEEGIGLAKQLRAAGHNIDSGIMQVNSGPGGEHWVSLNVSLEDTFNPCINIRAGAQEYCSYEPSQCQPAPQALSRYNTGSPIRGVENGYVRRVVNAFAKANPSNTSLGELVAVPSNPGAELRLDPAKGGVTHHVARSPAPGVRAPRSASTDVYAGADLNIPIR